MSKARELRKARERKAKVKACFEALAYVGIGLVIIPWFGLIGYVLAIN